MGSGLFSRIQSSCSRLNARVRGESTSGRLTQTVSSFSLEGGFDMDPGSLLPCPEGAGSGVKYTTEEFATGCLEQRGLVAGDGGVEKRAKEFW